MKIPLPRRKVLAAGGAAALAVAGRTHAAPSKRSDLPVPQRTLGKTGVKVSMVGLGGFHAGMQKTAGESVRLIRSAIDRGVTFMDNCWDYNDGASEERMGKALADGYRAKSFLMTKLDGRTRQSALEQLEQSLKRLRVDSIDLVQVHEVIRENDPERCFAKGGCMEALIEAKQAGKLRFIGFTGHKDPSIHLAMLNAADAHGFAFDAVQLPLNALDVHYRSFEQLVLPVLLKKDIGVLGMKALGAGKLLESKAVTAVECLRYALSLPTSVVITGCETMARLDQAVALAQDFKPMASAERLALLERTRDAGKDGRFEEFKTTLVYDGTTKNPHWLETSRL